ncbi:MAG TPA: hypothetical protein VEV39_07565 [Gemmatimonadales bacterium]|nr:hypothetical protein [Gemmatimonadales bacterium]
MKRLLTAATATTAALGLLVSSGYWRPGDRVLISDFSEIEAVAASSFKVYAATLNGLIIYDRGAGTFDLPQTRLDGYPSSQVRFAVADPVGNGVWLGTNDGWAHYNQDINQWDSGIIPGGARDGFLDSQGAVGGFYLQGMAGWYVVQRGGLAAIPTTTVPPPNRRTGPQSARALLARAPVVFGMQGRLLTDSRLRTYQFTAGAMTQDRPNEMFLGTTGLGLLRVDPTSGQGAPLSFGLPNQRASVTVAGPGGVWTVGSARAGERRALTWVAEDLSKFTINEDALGRGTQVLLAQRMLYVNNALWLGTSLGLYQMPTGDGTGHFYDVGAGLPGPNVLSLAKAPDGIWVGTAQGLAHVTPEGTVTRMTGYDRAVVALVAQRESLWVGTVDGLALLAPGSTSPTLPPELAAAPTLRAPVVALANTRDTIVVATADQLGWRNPADGSWTVLRPRAPVGTITALAPDAGGVWIAGTGGLVFWDIAHQTFHGVSVPNDIPAAIRDVTVEGEHVWAATDAGLVRLSRDAALHR